MKKLLVSCTLALFVCAVDAQAAVRTIEMVDGTVIQGEILSAAGGIYTIKSATLGTIKVEESKIRSISSPASEKGSDAGSNASAVKSEAASIQEKMMNDQEIMSMIQSLQNDPAFKKAMEDPELMKAVQAGDVAALSANPKFMKLLENATVKDIQKKVK